MMYGLLNLRIRLHVVEDIHPTPHVYTPLENRVALILKLLVYFIFYCLVWYAVYRS
jgi:hypothetical protein